MDMSAIASKLKMPMRAESKAPSLDDDLDAMYGDAGAKGGMPEADLTKVSLADASLEQLQMAMDKLKAASKDTEEADADMGAAADMDSDSDYA